MLRFLRLFRLALWRGFEHDIFTVARAAAYYSILTFFPALMVVAAVMALSHEKGFMRQVLAALYAVLPPGSPDVVRSYLESSSGQPIGTVISASFIMLMASSGVVVSWMEGFTRAYQMERCWHPVKQRLIALLLVLLASVPMGLATFSAAFGSEIEKWMMSNAAPEVGPWVVLLLWRAVRWLLSILTSIAVLALIYHLGLPRWQPWYRVMHGATLATVLWLAATEAFGWYVVNYGTYNIIYGPLGAAIALLVWLYIISIIVLIGAEFNALVYPRPQPCPEAKPANEPETKEPAAEPSAGQR